MDLVNGVSKQSWKILISGIYAEWRWMREFSINDEHVLCMGKVLRCVRDLDKERYVIEVKREGIGEMCEEGTGVSK